jgi:NitT/TauT family transport system substrate-binding protein
MLVVRPELQRAELEELAQSFVSSWAVNGGLNAAQVGYSIDQQYLEAEFKGVRRVSREEFWDTGPVDAALRAIGTAPGIDAPGR